MELAMMRFWLLCRRSEDAGAVWEAKKKSRERVLKEGEITRPGFSRCDQHTTFVVAQRLIEGMQHLMPCFQIENLTTRFDFESEQLLKSAEHCAREFDPAIITKSQTHCTRQFDLD